MSASRSCWVSSSSALRLRQVVSLPFPAMAKQRIFEPMGKPGLKDPLYKLAFLGKLFDENSCSSRMLWVDVKRNYRIFLGVQQPHNCGFPCHYPPNFGLKLPLQSPHNLSFDEILPPKLRTRGYHVLHSYCIFTCR